MGVVEYDPNEALLDRERIGRALVECLEEGDHEGFVEVIEIYANALRRAHASRKASAPKVTFSKNPSIQTIAKYVRAST
jgi:DNA-binding phage protein